MEEKVRVVERAFDIIEALACSRKSMSVTDIAKLTQISKSTTSRLLQTMHSRGFVEKDENQAYSIGYKLIDVVRIPGSSDATPEIIDSMSYAQLAYTNATLISPNPTFAAAAAFFPASAAFANVLEPTFAFNIFITSIFY